MNLAAEPVIIGGQTVKKRLVIALVGGFLFLGSLLALFGITGVAYAVPVSGIGNFDVQFEKLVGTGFKLYGGVSDGGNVKGLPVAVNEMKHATITGLVISKEFPLLNLRAVIKSDKPVEIDGLIQKATQINGDAKFSSLTMAESYVGDIKNPLEAASKEFTQDAETITIDNGKLQTLYLFQQAVTLNGMQVYFEKIDSSK